MVDGAEQAKAFEKRTGLGTFAPTHISHKRVEAYSIAAAEFSADGSGRVGVNDPARGYVVVPVPAGFLRRPGAVTEGDMLVRYEPTTEEPNGYLSHSPRAVFEAGYRRLLADVEIATGAPILTLAEAQSVVATKTAPRITEELMREQIATVEYARLRHLTICVITLKNGFFSYGMSAPADPSNYDAAVGERYAFDNAFRKLWPMFGFLLRDRLSGGSTLAAVPGLGDAIHVEGASSITVDQPPAA